MGLEEENRLYPYIEMYVGTLSLGSLIGGIKKLNSQVG